MYEDSYLQMVDESRAEISRLKRRLDAYRKLLDDVDQCAPAVLRVSELGLDFATALQAVRDELEG
jgi:hypothetical protein